MSWWSRVTAVIIVCPAALMNIVPETRRKTVLDILGMIIGVKLSFVVDIRIIKNVSFKATKAFWCCHRHVLRLSLAPLVSFTNSFYIFKTNFQCTIHSFWIMGIGINQAYAEHKLMKTFTKYIHFLQSELNILYGVQKISAFIHTFWNWGGRRNISLSQLFPRWSQRSTLLCPTQHWPTFTAQPFKCHLVSWPVVLKHFHSYFSIWEWYSGNGSVGGSPDMWIWSRMDSGPLRASDSHLW